MCQRACYGVHLFEGSGVYLSPVAQHADLLESMHLKRNYTVPSPGLKTRRITLKSNTTQPDYS